MRRRPGAEDYWDPGGNEPRLQGLHQPLGPPGEHCSAIMPRYVAPGYRCPWRQRGPSGECKWSTGPYRTRGDHRDLLRSLNDSKGNWHWTLGIIWCRTVIFFSNILWNFILLHPHVFLRNFFNFTQNQRSWTFSNRERNGHIEKIWYRVLRGNWQKVLVYCTVQKASLGLLSGGKRFVMYIHFDI